MPLPEKAWRFAAAVVLGVWLVPACVAGLAAAGVVWLGLWALLCLRGLGRYLRGDSDQADRGRR